LAALVGDTARATMLSALMGGQALTASELAARARIAKSTASGHLTKLVRARLLAVTQKRRNRYYRIASPLVAKMLESIKAVAAIDVPPRYQPRSTQDDRLRFARTCYDHLAGQLGVAIADALVSKGYVVLTDDGGEGGFRCAFPFCFRRRIGIEFSKQADFLPTVPRLERTPISRCGSCRHGNYATLCRTRLA
jgi:DNA-binding transcriptional ArsR family regulator